MATNKQLEQELEQLRAEVAELRSQKERLARWSTRVAGFATGAAARILLGPGLVGSLQAWLRGLRRAIAEKALDDRVLDETGSVLAAIVRRVIRVGVLGAVITVGPAVVTVAVLLWQNFLIREQNTKIQSQIEQQQVQVEQQMVQIEQQASDTLIVRRAQLLATIYEEECEPAVGSATKQICRPKAPLRTRQEAVLAFIDIERGRGASIDLSRVSLRGADLSGVDLGGVDLSEANLSEANLSEANLSEANLSRADLSKANVGRANLRKAELVDAKLRGANLSWKRGDIIDRIRWEGRKGSDLRGANLRSADLREADLGAADLGGAGLSSADLSGADLSGANLNPPGGPFFSVTQKQIDAAQGDAETKLPPDLERPARWLKEE